MVSHYLPPSPSQKRNGISLMCNILNASYVIYHDKVYDIGLSNIAGIKQLGGDHGYR